MRYQTAPCPEPPGTAVHRGCILSVSPSSGSHGPSQTPCAAHPGGAGKRSRAAPQPCRRAPRLRGASISSAPPGRLPARLVLDDDAGGRQLIANPVGFDKVLGTTGLEPRRHSLLDLMIRQHGPLL